MKIGSMLNAESQRFNETPDARNLKPATFGSGNPKNLTPARATKTSVSGKIIAKSIGLTPLNRYEIEKLTPSTTQATKREESSLPEIVENFARRGTPRGRSVLIAPLRSERM